jgi:hypothetical protein
MCESLRFCITVGTHTCRSHKCVSTYDSDDDVYLHKHHNERMSQNLYFVHFHTDQPKRHKSKKYQ